MTKTDIAIISDILLFDPEQHPSRIVKIEGAEMGYDHLRLYTQSTTQNEYGVCTLYKIYAEEMSMEKVYDD